jgi:hypothetical protein
VAEVNLAADPPQGMIFHWAGDLDGKFTVTEIWDTREANERFLEERLFPTIRKLSGREPRERERAGSAWFQSTRYATTSRAGRSRTPSR